MKLKHLAGAIAVWLGMVGATVAITPAQAHSAAPPSSGINNWNCKPSAAHPEPVVLVHGMGANAPVNFATLAPAIAADDNCVFMETYGTIWLGPAIGGLDSMRTSAATLARFVDRVRAATGAAKVNIVGHSEGTTVPAYYLKFLGGDTAVKKFIGFGSNFAGTTLYGLGPLAVALGFDDALNSGGCGACKEFLPGSDFLEDLNAGGVTVAGPQYTSIISTYDTVVVPYTSGRLAPAPNVKNIVLQQACGLDFSGHLGLAVDPNVASLVLRELDPSNRLRCVPYWALGL
ncbi:esterase/lipase family protein [Nocardioides sp. Bht2]|uniref:esterase/lipase family protein n=1 Tax=Nocardioides sp. Bht2 TaxID=3392297 RepID=UPI0039B657D0